VGVVPSSGGVAPIATQEHLEEDPEEENCNESNNDNADIIGRRI